MKRVGIIVVTADKGLCGGLNTNVLRPALAAIRDWQAQGEEIEACAIGNKGLAFIQRLGGEGRLAGHAVSATGRSMEKLIGAVKVMLDGYTAGRFDRLYSSTTSSSTP